MCSGTDSSRPRRARAHWGTHRRARALIYTHARARTHTPNFRFRVLCGAGGVVKTQRPSPNPDVRTSVPERCAECTCACDTRSNPLPLCHLPFALSAEPPPTLAPGRAASLLEKPRGAERGACHPLRRLRQPGTRGGTSLWNTGLGPALAGYSPAPQKGDRKPRGARASRRSTRLAPEELAAAGKGRGPTKPLTHPVRACREGAEPSRRQRWREPVRRRSQGKGRAEGAGGGATEQITPRPRRPLGLAGGGSGGRMGCALQAPPTPWPAACLPACLLLPGVRGSGQPGGPYPERPSCLPRPALR